LGYLDSVSLECLTVDSSCGIGEVEGLALSILLLVSAERKNGGIFKDTSLIFVSGTNISSTFLSPDSRYTMLTHSNQNRQITIDFKSLQQFVSY